MTLGVHTHSLNNLSYERIGHFTSSVLTYYFIVANTLVATTILGPVLYQLWIYNGSANANFFFAITLVFSTAQIFLITDLLFAYVKREFYVNCGFKAIKPNDLGGPQIVLQ